MIFITQTFLTEENVDAGRTGEQTTDAAPWHKLSWPSARWANK